MQGNFADPKTIGTPDVEPHQLDNAEASVGIFAVQLQISQLRLKYTNWNGYICGKWVNN